MTARKRAITAWKTVVIATAILAMATQPTSAVIIFSESFESPVVEDYANNTVPDNGSWVGANKGYGSGNRGLYNEGDGSVFSTPYGAQVYAFRYTNSGLTTAEGVIGNLQAGITYTISFDAAADLGGATPYNVQLIAFGAGAARNDCRSTPPDSEVLASVNGNAPEDGSWATVSFDFTADAVDHAASIGKDIGIRFRGASTSAIIDYVRFTVGGDLQPSPPDGATLPAGDVVLSWTNLTPNVGSDVWVDVWFGTDTATDFTKVVSAGLNQTSVTVSAPVANTYYWKVDSYINGSPTGDFIEDVVFTFYVDDTDADGLPDAYELLHTNPPSGTALNPEDDLEPDGLTNMEEYKTGTNPNDADSDDDTLLDGPELAGAGSRPPTDPLDADTDDDGLSDAAETNTGAWVSAADTGTDPTDADYDNDGLKDGVETNTGVFVDKTNTGTDPYLADTDDDTATDWYETIACYTNPHDPADNPGIPYPLPDPDGSTGAADKPVKVYILSGQSNMVGMGNIGGTSPGTLETVCKRENKFPNLVDDTGAWTVRNDVMYRGVITAIGNGPLTPGVQGNSIGPDIGFGHVMGYYHDEPVIVLKTSQGNRSIGWDCLPPGSERYVYNEYTYAGYGDSPNRWLTGTGPSPFVWYAGKQYDDYFLDEPDMGPPAWTDATEYPQNCQVRNNGVAYISKSAHTSSAASEPGVGAQSSTYWNTYSVFNATDVLDNFASEYPQYAEQGFEIAGFGWWQGHKDQYDASYADRYEFNLTNLINETRQYYENRYPDKIKANAPFVVATIGFDGGPYAPDSAYGKIHAAQLAVADPVKHPEFAGNVATTDSLGYWRTVEESPSGQNHHYNRNAETFLLVGDAMGRAMIGLDSAYSLDAGDDMITWTGRPVELDATVQEGITIVSYAWTADPAEGVVFDPPAANVEDPTVTITKPASTLNPVAVVNPGFENPVLGDGGWTTTPAGWNEGYYDLTDPGVWVAGDAEAGAYNPTVADGYGGIAPEGNNVMYTTSAIGYDKGMSQVLSATLEANTQYSLSALVGNPYLFNGSTPTGDYRIELLAGGVILASDSGPSPADDTTWTTAELTYDSGESPAQLGETLEIRIVAASFTDGKGVDFDDVQLFTESPAPDPYPVRLILTVNDGVNAPVANNLTIDVYNDACTAARIGKDMAADNPGDFDEDCITGASDLAEFAAKWLNQGGLTEPITKP